MPETWPQWMWFAFFVGGSLGGWAMLALAGLWYYLTRRME